MCSSIRIAFAILVAALNCQLTAAPIDDITNDPLGQTKTLVPNGIPTPATDGDIFGRDDGPPSSEKPVSSVLRELLGVVPDEPHVASPANHEPSESDVAIQKAIEEFKSGNIYRCRSHLRDAVSKKPNLPPPDLLLADIYLGAGLRRQARDILEKAATSGENHPQMHYTFGRLALAEGRLVEALMHYEKMEQLGAPSGWDEHEKVEFELAILAGKTVIAERRSQWMLAQSLLWKWVQQNPKDAALRSRWATALLHGGQVEKAFDHFDIAFRQDDTLNSPETAIASVYAFSGRFREADRWYEKSLDVNADDPRTHFAWSIALAMQDRWKEAETRATRAAELGIDTTSLTLHRGVIARAMQKYEEAEVYLSRVIDVSPDHREATYQLVLTLAGQDDAEMRSRALKLAQSNLANQPQSVTAKAALGIALAGNQDYAAAEQTLSPIAPHLRPESLFIYTQILLRVKKPEQARLAALHLKEQVDERGIFVARRAARKWLATVSP